MSKHLNIRVAENDGYDIEQDGHENKAREWWASKKYQNIRIRGAKPVLNG